MVNIVHLSSADGKASGAKKAIYGSKRSKYARALGSLVQKDIKETIDLSRGPGEKRNPLRRCFGSIYLEIKNFFTFLPLHIRHWFVGAFLAPAYRPEWGDYTKWDPERIPGSQPHEKRFRLIPKRKNKKKKQKKKRLVTKPPAPVPHDHSECQIVKINVSGKMFQFQMRTLNQFPGSLLGNPDRMMQYYHPEKNEFFFDRHRTSFEAILTYFQTGGIIRKPPGVGWDLFIEEVKFYDLGADILKYLEHKEGNDPEDEIALPKGLFRRKIWLLFEYPESSHQSRIVAALSILAVTVSIFEFCVETIPTFCWESKNWSQAHMGGLLGSSADHEIDSSDFRDPFLLTETVCIVFFCVEYVVRLLSSPNMLEFVKQFSNIVDLVAIFPFFVNLVNYEPAGECESGPRSSADSLTIFRIFRLVRVFRILKLSRHNKGLKILGKTLKASLRELGLFMFFLFIGVVVFSSALYFVETGVPGTHFDSIPTGFWFSIVTMTTLGYGDIVPTSVIGKVIGSLCAIAGVLAVSLPVPVIVSNFNAFYKREVGPVHEKIDHVEQCPYFPAWYDREGNVSGESLPFNTQRDDDDDLFQPHLIGDHKPDYSDSDFEELKKDDVFRKRPAPFRRKTPNPKGVSPKRTKY